MGWRAFCAACVAAAILLLAPGYFGLRCLRIRRIEALCLAPACSIALTGVLGVLYAPLGIPATWITTAAIPTVVLAVIAVALQAVGRARVPAESGRHAAPALRERSDLLPLALYVAVGCIAAILMFAGNIDGAAAFEPDNDNAFHLNLIRALAESHRYSTLSVSLYAASPVAATSSAGFYPIAFHCIAANLVSMLGIGISVAENATALVTIALVYSLSTYWLMSRLMKDDGLALYLGAFVMMGIVAFPWRLLTWGPLFPNMLSMALIPGTLGALVEAMRGEGGRSARIRGILVFLIGCVAVGLAHPNGIFTLGILSAGFLASWLWFHARARGRVRALAAVAVFLLLACGVWAVLYKLPSFQGVVNFRWVPYEDVASGVGDALSLKLADSRGGQPLLAICVLAGLAACLTRRRDLSWLVPVYVFMAFQFVLCASTSGAIRHIFSGFWYTDTKRVAANLALAIVPLASLGGAWLIRLIARAVLGKDLALESGGLAKASAALLAIAVVGLGLGHLAYTSDVESPDKIDGYSIGTDAFSANMRLLKFKYAAWTEKAYDLDEQRFVNDALKLVPDGAAILNQPNDGSCFAYALQGAQVYYKSVGQARITEEADGPMRVIRLNLDKVSTDASVRDALRALDVHYLLLLDQGDFDPYSTRELPPFNANEWRGYSAINDETPGFKTLLARDDMRLYEIEY